MDPFTGEKDWASVTGEKPLTGSLPPLLLRKYLSPLLVRKTLAPLLLKKDQAFISLVENWAPLPVYCHDYAVECPSLAFVIMTIPTYAQIDTFTSMIIFHVTNTIFEGIFYFSTS